MSKMVNILNTADILARKLNCSFVTFRSLCAESNALGHVNVSLRTEPDFSHMARSFLSAEGQGTRSVKSSAIIDNNYNSMYVHMQKAT